MEVEVEALEARETGRFEDEARGCLASTMDKASGGYIRRGESGTKGKRTYRID